jgi:thioredoxin 2
MARILRCAACGGRNRIPEDKAHLRPKCGRCGTVMRKVGEVIEVTDQNYSQVVERAAIPVLLDLYSPTCGPCQMLAPVIAELARSHGDRVLIAKLDTSRSPQVPGRFNIRGVPTLLLLKEGKVQDQLVGLQPQQVIEQRLAALLG